MKKVLFAVLIAFLTIPFAGARTDAAIIKLAAVMPEGSTWIVAIHEMIREISKQSNGEVNIKLYAGGIAGDELDVIRKMRVNRIQAAAFSGVGLGQIMPHIRVLETPRLLQTDREVDIVKERMFDEFAADFLQKDMILLGFAESGFVKIFSKQKVESENSFKTLRMWTWKGDPLAEMFIGDFGINTVPLHITDVNTGLDTGMIDSFYGPPLAATAFQWYARTKYMLDLTIVHSIGASLMNRQAFESLSPKNQEIVKRVFKINAAELVRLTRKDNQEARQVLEKSGITFVKPSAEMITAVDDYARKTVEKCILKFYSRDLYDRIKAIVDDIRSGKL